MNELQDFFVTVARVVEPFNSLFIAIALSSLRLFAAFNLLPAMGEQFIQGYVRTGTVVVIGAFVAFGLPADAAAHLSAAQWLGFAVKESMIGLVLGFAASSVFWVAQSVGALIDTQAGFNNVQLSNPLSGESSTPVSNLLLQLVVVVFFQLGGMLVFIGAVFESFQVWPIFAPLPELSKVPDVFLVQQTDSMMASIVKFAAPILLVLVLIDLGFGLVTRTADKLQPANLSQPIKGAVTLLLLALLAGVLITQVRHLLLPTGLLTQLKASLGVH
jgi:type III secretion protein T